MLERWSQYAALPLRGVLGCSFVVLGANGLTPGTAWAWIMALLEIVGGVAIVLGVLTRWVALLLALESLAVLVAVGQATNVEFRLVALAAFVALALLGPQRYALD